MTTKLLNKKNKNLQFELLYNCSNGCDFCYMREQSRTHNITTNEFVINRLNSVKSKLMSNDIKKMEFDSISFIGGELFDYPLENVEIRDLMFDIFNISIDMIKQGMISSMWIATNLIAKQSCYLFDFLKTIPNHLYNNICICTSYDVKGRFKSNTREVWLNNVKSLKETFPSLRLHCETILTQNLIDSVLNSEEGLEDFISLYNLMDLAIKEPSFFLENGLISLDCIKFNDKDGIDKHLNYRKQHPLLQNFFIKDENSLFKFMHRVIPYIGISIFERYACEWNRSDMLYLVSGAHLDDRSSFSTLLCGHPMMSMGYENSSDCIRCDMIKYLTINNYI